MGRRRKSGGAEGLMDLVALLPWWAGTALAALSYWWLHGIATRPQPLVQTGRQISEALPTMMWQGFATGGQYLIPFICLLGALASFVRRRKRRALFDDVSQASGVEALQGISWQEFEMLVGEGFRRRGYGVRETGGGGADGGVDLLLTRDGEKILVQCKQWKAFKVGVSTVRELYGVMAAEGVAAGIVVTSGRFTSEASAFAAGRNIQLMDGAALKQLLGEARTHQASHSRATVGAATKRDEGGAPPRRVVVPQDADGVSISPAKEPNCPRCAKPMVQRTSKRGRGAGTVFWGCSDFAGGCRGTREL